MSRVLVVEDEEHLAQGLRFNLEAEGYEAEVVGDGESATDKLLVKNDGKIVSRKQILEEVWGLHEDTDTRAIDNFVVRLRRYIEDDPGNPRHLLTVRGVGYKFLAQPNSR